MGMFDTVRIPCPHCGHLHREQTKSGPCELREVDLTDLDPSMASGLVDSNGLVWCDNCKDPIRIELVTQPSYRAVPVDRRQLWGDDND